jgi:uncharacterized protein
MRRDQVTFIKGYRVVMEVVKEYVLQECNNGRNALGPAFFDQHLLVVVNYAKSLAETLGAGPEIVEVAAWLHDIAAVQDITALPRHPGASAEVARRVLGQDSHSSEWVDRVARCILSHAVPIQMGSGASEEVCLSNADAMSRIVGPTYWLYFAFRVRQLGYEEGKTWLRQRVESDWAALIRPARAMIEKQYRQTKKFLE